MQLSSKFIDSDNVQTRGLSMQENRYKSPTLFFWYGVNLWQLYCVDVLMIRFQCDDPALLQEWIEALNDAVLGALSSDTVVSPTSKNFNTEEVGLIDP